MGDPAGIGPEICLDLLADRSILEQCTPIIIGNWQILATCAEMTGKRMPPGKIEVEDLDSIDRPGVLDRGSLTMSSFSPGRVSADTGMAAYNYIIKSIDLAKRGLVDGVATAPINKEALRAAGVHHPGHTEIFAEQTGTESSCMMLTSDILTCSFVTVHVGLCEVPDLITKERILEVIELTRDAMKRIRNREPVMVVCGLNPHAGEGGLFGQREEEEQIIPAIQEAKKSGARLVGPLPPDTAFLDWRREETDAFICMYHDQGHIPLKALAFDRAINTTLGLPIVRTSVDHGTALDIAWQGKANPQSLKEAVLLASRLGSANA